MAHGITATDGMMLVRETPWHRLGVVLPQVANAAEAIAAAKLGWTVRKDPLLTTDGTMVPGHFAMVREDTGAALGVVGCRYVPLQNVDAFRFFDQVVKDPNGAKFHTAGSLHGGRKVWMLAKLPSFVRVGDDVTEEYLLLTSSHDGSSPVRMLFTPVRVVCQNTLSLALRGNGSQFSHFHTSSILQRVTDAQMVLRIASVRHIGLREDIERMAAATPSKAQVERVMRKLFPVSERSETGAQQAARTRTLNVRAEVVRTFRNSPTCNTPGAKGTGWGLYNALTEWSDHRERKGTDDAKVESILFGTGAQFKVRALNAVLSLK